ncbi:hypothetical protein J6590_020577 [Homalodisca vitripennis]|nr:hypothetical protein J6590_020577 [Homalodisca vitripennis]
MFLNISDVFRHIPVHETSRIYDYSSALSRIYKTRRDAVKSQPLSSLDPTTHEPYGVCCRSGLVSCGEMFQKIELCAVQEARRQLSDTCLYHSAAIITFVTLSSRLRLGHT